jgi:hypothetical protein
MSQQASSKTPQPRPFERYTVLIGSVVAANDWLREEGRSARIGLPSNRDVICINGSWATSVRLTGLDTTKPIDLILLHDHNIVHPNDAIEVYERIRLHNAIVKKESK